MLIARRNRRITTFVGIGIVLMMIACGDSSSHEVKTDASVDGGASCKPSECEGQPVPEIACADGPTITVCERGSDGLCHPQVSCESRACGTSAGNSACAKSEFCNYEKGAGGTGCDAIDPRGTCQRLPDACPEIYMPVCGCDQKTYGNACDAHGHGVSVRSEGACSDGGSATLSWYLSCGDPVCRGHTLTDVAKCTTEQMGAACSDEGAQCDPGDECNARLVCAAADPKRNSCPISRAHFKQDIEYLDERQLAQYHDQVIGLGLAHYHYRNDASGEQRLGFIVEDVEPSTFVEEARDRVDLYAYTSALVAAIKVQDVRIRRLEAELAALRARRSHPKAKR